MPENTTSRREFLNKQLPGLGAVALSAVHSSTNAESVPAAELEPALDIEQAKRALFEGAPFPDQYSDRKGRMISLYPIAQEAAAELFEHTGAPFTPRPLKFLGAGYMAAVNTEHTFRSRFIPTRWTVHETVAPSSTNPVIYANEENGNPWLTTSDRDADMEFTLMSIASQLQAAATVISNPEVTIPDKQVLTSWGGYLYTTGKDGSELLHRFADGMNIYASRILLLKRHLEYVQEHQGAEILEPYYPVSQFHAFAEIAVMEMLNRLKLPPQELARVTGTEGASSMISYLESTYQENGYDEQTGIDAHTAACRFLEIPELQSGDSLEQRVMSFNTIVLSAIDQLLPLGEQQPTENNTAPLINTLGNRGNAVFTIA